MHKLGLDCVSTPFPLKLWKHLILICSLTKVNSPCLHALNDLYFTLNNMWSFSFHSTNNKRIQTVFWCTPLKFQVLVKAEQWPLLVSSALGSSPICNSIWITHSSGIRAAFLPACSQHLFRNNSTNLSTLQRVSTLWASTSLSSWWMAAPSEWMDESGPLRLIL